MSVKNTQCECVLNFQCYGCSSVIFERDEDFVNIQTVETWNDSSVSLFSVDPLPSVGLHTHS